MTYNEIHIPKDTLCKLYSEERKSIYEIAKLFSCSGATVWNKLRANEILIRTMSESKKGNIPWNKGKSFPFKIRREKRFCACGCGESFECKVNNDRRYIAGHNQRGKSSWNKGKHPSEETLRKLRQSHLDIPFPESAKQKLRTFHISKEALKKLYVGETMSCSEIARLHNCSDEVVRRRLIDYQIPRRKGNPCELTVRIRNLPEYKQWRSDVFQRDNWICQTCGAKSQVGERISLEAHHIKSFSQILEHNSIGNIWEAQFCKELWDTNNGVTLCTKCHQLTKQGRKRKDVRK